MEDHWAVPVGEFMTRRLVAVTPDAPLSEVQRTLDQHQVSAVPVLEDGKLRGIISTKEMLHQARVELGLERATAPSDGHERRASDLMHSPVVTIGERAPLEAASRTMLAHRIHRLIVVDDAGGAPTGVISVGDVMKAIAQSRVRTPLSDVMTKNVQTIDENDPIDAAVERLDDANVHGLVVLEGTWPVGVFTHAEAIRVRALPRAVRKIPVERIMSYEIVCLDRSTPVGRVARYAREMRVRRVLAVERHHLCGIASGLDLLRVMAAA
jgi:CBS domain-containing protein